MPNTELKLCMEWGRKWMKVLIKVFFRIGKRVYVGSVWEVVQLIYRARSTLIRWLTAWKIGLDIGETRIQGCMTGVCEGKCLGIIPRDELHPQHQEAFMGWKRSLCDQVQLTRRKGNLFFFFVLTFLFSHLFSCRWFELTPFTHPWILASPLS